MSDNPIVSTSVEPRQLSLFDPIEIPLTKGYVALVDPIDADLAKYKWRPLPSRSDANLVYAQRSFKRNGKEVHVLMHREIMGRMTGAQLSRANEVDHWDNNPLNNCRGNLRIASHSDNQHNSPRPSNNTSGYKGVYKRGKKWVAQIKTSEKKLYLGSFATPQEAHEAYKTAAIKYFGEFARFE